MELRVLERLARLVAELDLSEIEVKRLGEQVRIVRRPPGDHPVPGVPAHPFVAAAPISPQPETRPAPESQKDSVAAVQARATIKAPLVGTFYRAPAPDAPPYVEVGQVVEPGQTVCIIEAMKIMNEIHAEVRGRVVSILVANAQPVEFGQALMELDTNL